MAMVLNGPVREHLMKGAKQRFGPDSEGYVLGGEVMCRDTRRGRWEKTGEWRRNLKISLG